MNSQIKPTVELSDKLNELSFSFKRVGYGQYTVECEMYYKGQSKCFFQHSTDSMFFDALGEVENYQDKQIMFYNKFIDFFQDRIDEYIYLMEEDQKFTL